MTDFKSDNVIRLVLFPLGNAFLYKSQLAKIRQRLQLDEDFDLTDYYDLDLLPDDLTNLAGQMTTEDKVAIFNKAFEIADGLLNVNYNKFQILSQSLALSPLGKDQLAFDVFDDKIMLDYQFGQYLKQYSLISAAVGFIPFVPVSDYLILTPIQIFMCNLIFGVYGVRFDPKSFLSTVWTSVGSGFIFRIIANIGSSLIPGIGWIINASVAFTGTYIIGRIAREYALSGGTLTKDEIKNIYELARQDAKAEWSKFKEYAVMNKDLLLDKFREFVPKKDEKSTK